MALKVPPGLNEGAVAQLIARDPKTGAAVNDETLTPLASAIAAAREAAGNLAHLEAVTLADKTQSHEAGLLQVASAATKTAERVAKALDGARSKALAEIERINKRATTPPPPRDTVIAGLEGEVRARLAAMSDEARRKAIDLAFKERDELVVHALVRATPMLVGMSRAAHDMLRFRYQEQFHPGEFARRKTLEKALERTTESGNLFVSVIREATESPGTKLAAEAKRQREEMLAAHSAGE